MATPARFSPLASLRSELLWIQQLAQALSPATASSKFCNKPALTGGRAEPDTGLRMEAAGLGAAQEFSNPTGCVPGRREGTCSPSRRMQVLGSPFSYVLSRDLCCSNQSRYHGKRCVREVQKAPPYM